MLKTNPCVFAVGDTYQIFVPVKSTCVMWVEIGGKCFYDHSNGVLKSMSKVHKVTVPQKLLDEKKEYKVILRKIIGARKAYFNKMGKPKEYVFEFTPVCGDEVRVYHIADTHNRVEEPVAAAKTFGKIDFLILNGDVPNHSGDIKYFDSIYQIVGSITGGNIPAIFVRGNHDTRGKCAELFADYIPTDNGKTYFTFRVGNIWGLALDCAEDKPDSNPEYGGTVCCHAFREEETEFIKKVADCTCHKDEKIMKKLLIAHNPFTMHYEPPFNIEEEMYTEWAKIIREKIMPDYFLCGHLHEYGVHDVGGKLDVFGQPCKLILGSKPGDNYYLGAGFVFSKDKSTVTFTDNKGKSEGPVEL